MSGSSSTTRIFFSRLALLCIPALHPCYFWLLSDGLAFLLQERQAKMKRGPFTLFALDPEASPVSLDNVGADGQADAQPGIGLLVGIRDLVESLENLVVMGFGDATAKVLDAHEHLLLVGGQ